MANSNSAIPSLLLLRRLGLDGNSVRGCQNLDGNGPANRVTHPALELPRKSPVEGPIVLANFQHDFVAPFLQADSGAVLIEVLAVVILFAGKYFSTVEKNLDRVLRGDADLGGA